MVSDDEPHDSGPLQLERVYQEIKWRIVNGRYRPATPLSETVLARVHKSSRTPVREALSRLGEEGYVERVLRRGYVVAPITLGAVQNAFEVRRIIETSAAALAAERADADAIARMDELAEYPLLEPTEESYRERLSTNDQFHLAVAAGSQNGLLVDLVRHSLMHHNRVLALGVEFPVMPASVPQHHAIVAAIEGRDVEGSRQAMAEHIETARRLVTDFLIRGRIRGVAL